MKRIKLLSFLLLSGLALKSSARDGYKIQVKFTDLKDSMVYLAHYYGKPLPTIYKCDSAVFKNGVATLESKEKLTGGIYMVLTSKRDNYFEFLLNNGDEMSITATTKKLPEGLEFKNTPENDRFLSYVKFLSDFGKNQQILQAELKEAKNSVDSASTRQKITDAFKNLVKYRREYVAKYPGTLLTAIFNAMEVPEVPEGVHRLPDGKVDSNFAYNYYKAHYWDHFDFSDDRLIHTPIFDSKLEEYMNKLVVPNPDSIVKETDQLLAKAHGTKELFKYILWWNTRNAETSKIMGMDKAFVDLVENHYMKGEASWLDQESLEKYVKRARDISPNLIGNIAPELIAQDFAGKDVPLSSVKAKYTLLVFYSPDCGHCIQEIPKVDSVYRSVLKDKGVKVYAFATEDESKWKEFVEKNKLKDWVHVADWKRHSGYYSKFDVNSTPVIYLLDERKIIQGKRLDHSNIASVIEMLEAKEKKAGNTNKKS